MKLNKYVALIICMVFMITPQVKAKNETDLSKVINTKLNPLFR